MKKTIIIVFLTLCFLKLAAQSPTLFLTPGISANAYSGDLSGIDKWTNAFHLGVKLNQKKRLNGSLNLSFGRWNGQNVNYLPPTINNQVPTPNTFFNTSFVTFNYSLNYNIIKKDNFVLFISQGFGLLRYNPKDQFDKDLQDQPATRLDNESYGNTTIFLPTMLGVIYFLPNHYGLGLQSGYLNSQSDYLDNISGWGIKSGNDNAFQIRLTIYAPLSFNSLTPDKNQEN